MTTTWTGPAHSTTTTSEFENGRLVRVRAQGELVTELERDGAGRLLVERETANGTTTERRYHRTAEGRVTRITSDYRADGSVESERIVTFGSAFVGDDCEWPNASPEIGAP